MGTKGDKWTEVTHSGGEPLSPRKRKGQKPVCVQGLKPDGLYLVRTVVVNQYGETPGKPLPVRTATGKLYVTACVMTHSCDIVYVPLYECV